MKDISTFLQLLAAFKKPICDSMQCLGSGSGPTQIQNRNKKNRQELIIANPRTGGGRGPFPLFPKIQSG
jgi:hypothetical protein